MSIKLLLLIAGCILISACANIAQENNFIKIQKIAGNNLSKKTFDSLGHLIQENIYYNLDSPKYGNGYIKGYYTDGKVKAIGFMKNGERDSFFYAYYRDGRMLQKWHYLEGNKMGSQYIYDSSNGHIIDYRFYLEGDSSVQFFYKYDIDTKKYTFDGKALYSMNIFDEQKS